MGDIRTIQEFLTRGELRLNRNETIYQIKTIDETGNCSAYVAMEGRTTSLILTGKEIHCLASLCFPIRNVR